MSSKFSVSGWIQAARLRTLPLAVSGISLGAILAWSLDSFRWEIYLWTLLTAILLQILSNFANDYGDFKKGVDEERGDRGLGSGKLSLSAVKLSLFVLAGGTLASGLWLLNISFEEWGMITLLFVVLGIVSIGAAVLYTVGKFAYGYFGLGDLMVFVFFGLVSVTGSFFLYLGQWAPALWESLWVAGGIGFLSTAVLNVNNIRDIEGDKQYGKNTIPVIIGREKALWYQLFLVLAPFLMSFMYLNSRGIQSIFFYMAIPIYVLHWIRLKNLNPEDRAGYNKLLKSMVLISVLFVLLFGSVLMMNSI
jgi:1,4-dihydroxy-2-naphthoate octaprenyltransferase